MDHPVLSMLPGTRRLPGTGPHRLAIALISVLALIGCRSTPSTSDQAGSTFPQVSSNLSGPMIIPTGGEESEGLSPSMPTNPAPMPELTSSRSVNIHLDLGRIFESRNQFEAAEGEYRSALAAIDRKVDRPTQAEVHRRLAVTLDRQGKFSDSEPHHLAAMKLDPDNPVIWNNAGYSAYLQSRWDDAITRLRKAEKLDRNNHRTLTNLGLALAASGRSDEALDVLTRAGGAAAAQANLAYILAATGQTEKAREHYGEALRLNPAHSVSRLAIQQLDQTSSPPELVADQPPRVDPAVSQASFTPSEESAPPRDEPQPVDPSSTPLPFEAAEPSTSKKPSALRGILTRLPSLKRKSSSP